MGHVFSYLGNELQNKILLKSNENGALARGLGIGLGIGLGYVFYYLDNNNNKELQYRIFRETDINKVLAKNLGAYPGYNLSRLKDHNLLQKVLTKAEENLEFAKGICMDEDFDNNIKYLNKESQDRLIDICKHLDEKYGYERNKFSFNDYPIIGFPNNTYYYSTSKGNEANNYNVIDDEMKEYLQMVIDEVKNENKNDKNE